MLRFNSYYQQPETTFGYNKPSIDALGYGGHSRGGNTSLYTPSGQPSNLVRQAVTGQLLKTIQQQMPPPAVSQP